MQVLIDLKKKENVELSSVEFDNLRVKQLSELLSKLISAGYKSKFKVDSSILRDELVNKNLFCLCIDTRDLVVFGDHKPFMLIYYFNDKKEYPLSISDCLKHFNELFILKQQVVLTDLYEKSFIKKYGSDSEAIQYVYKLKEEL